MEVMKLENIWEDWHIEGMPIGAGSFGTVYKAHKITQEGFGIDYYSAVKVIRVPSDDSEIQGFLADGMTREEIAGYYGNALKGLVAEINLMESLKGASNIVIIEDYKVVQNADQMGWTIYIRMELLKNLNQYRIEHPLEIKDIVRLGIDICSALEYCGKKRIIHRDIKPDNIFINSFGDFKLGDFGIARQLEMTNANLSQKGTSSYMAPEIFRREPYNSSVDIYSLGMVLYRLLNGGRLPFLPTHAAGPEDTQRALEMRLSGEPLPKPAGCDDRLFAIIQKACDADMYKRWKSPTHMKTELLHYMEFLEQGGQDNGAPGVPPNPGPQARGNAPVNMQFHEGGPQARESVPPYVGPAGAQPQSDMPPFGGPAQNQPWQPEAFGDPVNPMAQSLERSGTTEEFEGSDDKTVHMFVEPDADRTRGTWMGPMGQGQRAQDQAHGDPGAQGQPSGSFGQQIENEYQRFQQLHQAREAQKSYGQQASQGAQEPYGRQASQGSQAPYGQQASPGAQPYGQQSGQTPDSQADIENTVLRSGPKHSSKMRNIIIGCCCGAAVLALGFFTIPVSMKDTLFDKVRYAVADSQTRARLYVAKGDKYSGSTAIAYYKKALEAEPEYLEAYIGALRNAYAWTDQVDVEDYAGAAQNWLNMQDILSEIGALSATPDAGQQLEIANEVDSCLYYDCDGYDLMQAIKDGNPEGIDLMAGLTEYFAKYDQADALLNGKASMSQEKEYNYEQILDALYDSGQFSDIETAILSQALAQFPENEIFLDRQSQINDDAQTVLAVSLDEALAVGDMAKANEICASMQALGEGYYNDAQAKIQAYETTQNFLVSLQALMDARDYEGIKNAILEDTIHVDLATHYLVDGVYKTSVESGTGLIYDVNGLYYGGIENDLRKGQGIQLKLYSEGSYEILEGSWDGQANGECTKTDWDSDGDPITVVGNYTDGYENGVMTMSWSSGGRNWSAQYTAENGKIVSEVTQDEQGNYIYVRAYADDGASSWYYYDNAEALEQHYFLLFF